MYERQAPDWRWTAELTWWDAWLDEHFGDGPDPEEDPLGDRRHRAAFRRFWALAMVRGLAQDEEDLENLLDRAWGDT